MDPRKEERHRSYLPNMTGVTKISDLTSTVVKSSKQGAWSPKNLVGARTGRPVVKTQTLKLNTQYVIL